MSTRYFIYAEDLASALIGPFESKDFAKAHITFCKLRGDGAEMKVVTDVEAAELRKDIGMELTPEEDRKYVP